jgi:hypothetical protein
LQLEFPIAQRGGTTQRLRAARHQYGDGLDEAGINDDRDKLQEMRMVLRPQRVPGMADEDVPSPGSVLRMATSGGAATTPFGSHIGTLAVGKAADLVLIDWDKLAYPYLDPETPVLDAIVQRAKNDSVDLVMVAGEVVYQGGGLLGSTATPRCASCTNHCSVRSPTTNSKGGAWQKRYCPTSGAFTPAISTLTPTTPTTDPVRRSEKPIGNLGGPKLTRLRAPDPRSAE